MSWVVLEPVTSTDGRVVKAVDLSPTTVMCVGSIPTLCNFFIFCSDTSPSTIWLYAYNSCL